MGFCKICNAIIPDGKELCDNCQKKEKAKNNESYLDSLLSSVKNSAPDVDKLYKKKNAEEDNNDISASPVDSEELNLSQQAEPDDIVDYTVDMEDFEDLFRNLDSEDKLDVEDSPEGENLNDSASTDDTTETAQTASSQEDDTVSDSTNDSTEEDKLEGENDDILDLLGTIPSDDPISKEAKAISNIMSGKSVDNDNEMSDTTPKIGGVFSDALKFVTALNDPDTDKADLDKNTQDINEEDSRKLKKERKKAKKLEKKEKKAAEKLARKEKKEARKSAKEEKKAKRAEQKNRQQAESDNNQASSEADVKPKKGILKRLFDNVHDENTGKNEADGDISFESEQYENNAAATKEKTKRSKFFKRFKKGKAATDNEEDDMALEGDGKKSGSGRSKRAVKREKKRKRKEIAKVIDEIEGDEGRINRAGASIVFIFFGALALLLTVGTDKVAYSLSIRHATDYFDKQKYNEAYDEIYGIECKDEDRAIYNKIMTVMFVNKQLNSYNNYYYLGRYPQALDSLLKGLKRYDKYIYLASKLGIKTDLDYVRGQILAELKNVFGISEEEAMKINSIEDMDEYSRVVYNVAHININE